MLAVVKKPHIEINAEEIPEKLLKFLTDNYHNVEIINNDDELVDITETAWYRKGRISLLPDKFLNGIEKEMV